MEVTVMNKSIAILLGILLVMSLTSCSKNNDHLIAFPENGIIESTAIPEGPYAKRTADWNIYKNAEELISESDIVLIGKVKSIEFKVLDITNALPVSENTPDYAKELYTIYNIEVLTPYKGDIIGSISFRVMGGMVNYQVDEQIKVMEKECAFNRELGILVWENYSKAQCTVGKSYLFTLYQFETGLPTLLNLEQSVYSLDEPTRKNSIGNSNKVYYSGSVDDNGSPLISALDIISAFGNEDINIFEQNWVNGMYN